MAYLYAKKNAPATTLDEKIAKIRRKNKKEKEVRNFYAPAY